VYPALPGTGGVVERPLNICRALAQLSDERIPEERQNLAFAFAEPLPGRASRGTVVAGAEEGSWVATGLPAAMSTMALAMRSGSSALEMNPCAPARQARAMLAGSESSENNATRRTLGVATNARISTVSPTLP
jgi:hypothetical protein